MRRSRETITSTCSKDTTNSQRDDYGTMRSAAAMKGLLLAEVGGGMVQLGVGSGFTNGSRITSDAITPGGSLRTATQERAFQAGNLARHGTLITENASPERMEEELQRLLGNSRAKLKLGRTLLPPPGGNSFEHVQMEQAKSRARVDIDVVLESNVLVQGGIARGHAVLHVRRQRKKEGPVLIFGGKIRIIGFECIYGAKISHSFYQCSSTISSGKSYFDDCHVSQEFGEDFTEAREGTYHFPFSMRLPTSDENGCPKGILYGLSGAAVRYVAIVSFKLKDTLSGKRSIAHFYRTCEVWPRLDPERILVPAPRPLRATISKSFFMGGDGKLTLTASLIRLYWVAGQQCFVHLNIQNATKKLVTSVTLSLIRNIVIFRPLPQLDTLLGKSCYERDPDACQTTTTTKVIAESDLEAGDRATRGHVSAKGWWTGVPPLKKMDFSHSIVIPPSEVSIPRSRLLEVEYVLKVSLCVGTLLSTDVQVSLPVRLVGFLSLDPYINSVLDPASEHENRSGVTRQPDKDSKASYSEHDRADNLSTVEDESDPDDVSINETAFDEESDYNSDKVETVFGEDYLMADVPEEIVRGAVASACSDQVYGERAPRFADLYYACLRENQVAREATSTISASNTSNEPNNLKCRSGSTNELDLEAGTDQNSDHTIIGITACQGRPNSGPANSSFALRVEDKLRAMQKNASCSSASSSNTSFSETPVDELSTEKASDPQRTSDVIFTSCVAYRNLPSGDKTVEFASSRDLKVCKNEIRGRSGLVKSKIQELEKRFSAAG